MKHLGDYVLSKESFPKLDAAWKELKKPAFKALTEHEKLGRVSRLLLDFIEKAPEGSFLLIPVLDFIEKIHQDNILEHFHFYRKRSLLNKENCSSWIGSHPDLRGS